MGQLEELVGVETALDRVSSTLQEYARTLGAPVVGACHVTCSDESEWECAEAFQRSFAQLLLPALKPGRRAVFRTINLGARYEPGAIRVAENHFATPESRESFKLMVVKINAHVAVRQTPEGPHYGWMERYDSRSTCCGALAALVAGGDLPTVGPLREVFTSEGKDRVAMLNDTALVPEAHRALAAAIAGARLQAQAAVRDIQEHQPKTPTMFLVVPCVTVNRPGPDTELLVGRCEIDWTRQSPSVKYEGLGDDPSAYRIAHSHDRLRVQDAGWWGG
jgi:hypothetical protein